MQWSIVREVGLNNTKSQFAPLSAFIKLSWSNPTVISSQEIKLASGLPQTLCDRSVPPPHYYGLQTLKLLTFYCLDNRDGLASLTVFSFQPPFLCAFLKKKKKEKKKLLHDWAYFLSLYAWWEADWKCPPPDICWRQACGWTAKEELDDSILCLFESIFEEIYRRPVPAFPLSADILSAWIKPTLILKVTGKKNNSLKCDIFKYGLY